MYVRRKRTWWVNRLAAFFWVGCTEMFLFSSDGFLATLPMW